MISKNYQRKHLRAPYKGPVLYADESHVFKAEALNISEEGMLLNQLPSFPSRDEVFLITSVPQTPYFKNFSLLKMQTFSKELFPCHVIRVKAKMVRREELSQNLDNIFKSRFGLQFIHINPKDQKYIEEYVLTFASNLIYLQTLIDSFNTDDETKVRVRTLAQILGYNDTERISNLRSVVSSDYQSLQWL